MKVNEVIRTYTCAWHLFRLQSLFFFIVVDWYHKYIICSICARQLQKEICSFLLYPVVTVILLGYGLV